MPTRRRVDLKIMDQKSDPFGNSQAYTGIQQPTAPLEGLANGIPNWATNPDPLGIGVKGRGMDVARGAMSAQDPQFRSGPLPDPQWAGFHQSMAEQGVDRVRGGASPMGSNQITGTPTQPDYFTSGGSFMGKPAIGALQGLQKAGPQSPMQAKAADLYRHKYPGV